MISREALIQRGWQALSTDPDAPFVATGRPHTLMWLWDLAETVIASASELRTNDNAWRRAWVIDRAARESLVAALSTSHALVLCAELRVWDMELGVVAGSELDKLARRHVGAAAGLVLEAMTHAVCSAVAVAPELQELLRRAVEAQAAATVERVEAETNTGESVDMLGQRRLVAWAFREAVVCYLHGTGVSEPEDLARALIGAEARASRPKEQ